eukprot:Amastigsp_a509696_608.p4 type:complete len:103 gc:universal Amastigsp_a509696_608:243-551(+)
MAFSAACPTLSFSSESQASPQSTSNGRPRSRTTPSCSRTLPGLLRMRPPARTRAPHSFSSTWRTTRVSTARGSLRSAPSRATVSPRCSTFTLATASSRAKRS